jgi:hypothetical protein
MSIVISKNHNDVETIELFLYTLSHEDQEDICHRGC